MKRFKKLIKFILLLIVLLVLASGGVYLYIKMSPKLEIKSSNAFLFYYNNQDLFFPGTVSK